MLTYTTYLTPGWEYFTAYCRSAAGFYRGAPKGIRRTEEMRAHAAGKVARPRYLGIPVEESRRKARVALRRTREEGRPNLP